MFNSIMATDLGDIEMKALRNNRWDKAFATESTSDRNHAGTLLRGDEDFKSVQTVNRKATIVIETLNPGR